MSDAALPPRTGWPRALWGGFLSFVVPGLGQIYAGAWRLGVVLFAAAILLDLAWIALTWRVLPTPGPVAASAGIMVLFRLIIGIDAACRVRSRSRASAAPWYRSTWMAAAIMIAVNVGLNLIEVHSYPAGWRSFHVASGSNLPTLSTADYVVSDIYQAGRLPAYGDMVVFRHDNSDYIKRAVGLPGDRVQLRQGVLHLNGKPVPREALGPAASSGFAQYRETLPNGRSYLVFDSAQSAIRNTAEFDVPAGAFFVLGDNRPNSLDSRSKDFGFVPVANVIGIVRTIYWTTEPSRLLSAVK